jgi:hypothetical protein
MASGRRCPQNFHLLAATLPAGRDALDRHWQALRPHLNGLYLSFESGDSADLLTDAFPQPTLDRLRALKARYDPGGVLGGNFPIPPG